MTSVRQQWTGCMTGFAIANYALCGASADGVGQSASGAKTRDLHRCETASRHRSRRRTRHSAGDAPVRADPLVSCSQLEIETQLLMDRLLRELLHKQIAARHRPITLARRSTRRGGSSRRLLGRRWSRSRSRGRSRSDARFTATVHHAHFSSAALADRGTHRGVPYTDAIDQLTPQPTSLANRNDRIVRRLKRDVRHTLC